MKNYINYINYIYIYIKKSYCLLLYVGTLAFTSDIGEAFRPVFPPKLVTATYAISWLYCGTDVAYHGYQAFKNKESTNDIARVIAERTVFQSVASMGLPALTIHTVVDQGLAFFLLSIFYSLLQLLFHAMQKD